jgi:Arc/MetJ-type ribon-helix-helix transcriptional regulator
MTLTVRLPPRVEQELAEYCVKRRLTKSEVVKLALEELLRVPEARKADLSHPYIGSDNGQGDVSRHIKRLLRERFRGKRTRG